MYARSGFVAGMLLALLPVAAAADSSSSADAVVSAVEAKYADVTAMRASFSQTVHNPVFGDEVQSGEVVFARPSRMRWTFGDHEREFVTDGSTMWIYTKADNQVLRYGNFSAGSGGAESLLTSLNGLSELFEVVLADGPGTHLMLTPRQEGQVKSLRLSLTDDLLVDQVIITDPFDTVTEMTFSGVVLNEVVTDDLFTFEVPEGANVIDAGGT